MNRLAGFWFEKTEDIIENHVVSTDTGELPPELRKFTAQLEGRSMLVRRADPLPVECVVRGYLAGGGWSEYPEKGSISGIKLPEGLPQAARLPEPIFTPATKAELGEHDVNIAFESVVEQVGTGLAERIKRASLDLSRAGPISPSHAA